MTLVTGPETSSTDAPGYRLLTEAGVHPDFNDPKGIWRTDQIDSSLDSLVATELMEQHGAPADKPLGVYVVNALNPASILAKRLEEIRFGSAFDGNDPEFFRDHYGGMEANGSTDFITILDHAQKRAVAMIRTIRHTEPEGCRTVNDLLDPAMPWKFQESDLFGGKARFAATQLDGQVEDIATLAKAEDYDGLMSFTALKTLFSVLFRRALADPELTTWVTALDNSPPDNDPYGMVQWWTERVFETFKGYEEPVSYYGSNSVACWSNFREYEQRLKQEHPERHAQLAASSDLMDDVYFDPTVNLFLPRTS